MEYGCCYLQMQSYRRFVTITCTLFKVSMYVPPSLHVFHTYTIKNCRCYSNEIYFSNWKLFRATETASSAEAQSCN